MCTCCTLMRTVNVSDGHCTSMSNIHSTMMVGFLENQIWNIYYKQYHSEVKMYDSYNAASHVRKYLFKCFMLFVMPQYFVVIETTLFLLLTESDVFQRSTNQSTTQLRHERSREHTTILQATTTLESNDCSRFGPSCMIIFVNLLVYSGLWGHI